MPKRSRPASSPSRPPPSSSSFSSPMGGMNGSSSSLTAERLVRAVQQRATSRPRGRRLTEDRGSATEDPTIPNNEEEWEWESQPFKSKKPRLPATWMISLHQHREETAGRRRAAAARLHRRRGGEGGVVTERPEKSVGFNRGASPSSLPSALSSQGNNPNSNSNNHNKAGKEKQRGAEEKKGQMTSSPTSPSSPSMRLAARQRVSQHQSLAARLREMPTSATAGAGDDDALQRFPSHSRSSGPLRAMTPSSPTSVGSSSSPASSAFSISPVRGRPLSTRATALMDVVSPPSSPASACLSQTSPSRGTKPTAAGGRRRWWTRQKLVAVLTGLTRAVALRRFFGSDRADPSLSSFAGSVVARVHRDTRAANTGTHTMGPDRRHPTARHRRRRALREHLAATMRRTGQRHATEPSRKQPPPDGEQEEGQGPEQGQHRGGEPHDLEMEKDSHLTTPITSTRRNTHTPRAPHSLQLQLPQRSLPLSTSLGAALSLGEASSRAMFWSMVHAVVEERRRVILDHLVPALNQMRERLCGGGSPSTPAAPSSSPSFFSPKAFSLLEARSFPLFGLEVDVCSMQFRVTSGSSAGSTLRRRSPCRRDRGNAAAGAAIRPLSPASPKTRRKSGEVVLARPSAVRDIRRGIVLQETRDYVSVALLPSPCISSGPRYAHRTAWDFLCDVASAGRPPPPPQQQQQQEEEQNEEVTTAKVRLPEPRVVQVKKRFSCGGTLSDVCQEVACRVAVLGRPLSGKRIRRWNRQSLGRRHRRRSGEGGGCDHVTAITLAIVAGDPWEPRELLTRGQREDEDLSAAERRHHRSRTGEEQWRHERASEKNTRPSTTTTAAVACDSGDHNKDSDKSGDHKNDEKNCLNPYVNLLRNRCL